MAYLPREVFNHYIHGPYMHPVCQEFLENSGCKGDCMLAHPAKRVRIFHPRFLYESFPAGLVICCKNFVLYGDCACQHMDPAARREINLDMFFHPPLHIRNYLRKKILGPDAKDVEPLPPKDEEAIAKEEEDLIRLLEELKCSEEARAVRTATVATQTPAEDEAAALPVRSVTSPIVSRAAAAAAAIASPPSELVGRGSPGAVQQRRHTTPSRMRHSFPPPPPPLTGEFDASPTAAAAAAAAAAAHAVAAGSHQHHHQHQHQHQHQHSAAAAIAALSPRPVRSSSRRLSVPSSSQSTSAASPAAAPAGSGLLSEQRRRYWLLTQQLHLIAAMTGRSLSPDPAVLAACPPLDDQAIKAALNLPASAEVPPIFDFLRIRAQQQQLQSPVTVSSAAGSLTGAGLTSSAVSSAGAAAAAAAAAASGTDALTQLLSANPFPFAIPGGLGYGLNC